MDNGTAMLKLMGLDPEKIKVTLTESKDEIMRVVNSINSKLNSIQDALTRLEVRLDTYPYDAPVTVVPERMLHDGGNDSDNCGGISTN